MTTKAPDQIEALREAGQYMIRVVDHLREWHRDDPDDRINLMVKDGCAVSSENMARAVLAHVNEPQPQPKQTMCERCDGGGYAWGIGACPDCDGVGWVDMQPVSQPDPADLEALVAVILDAMLGRYPGRSMARAVADALIAAGWRKIP